MTQEKMRKIIAACVSAATVLFVLLFSYLIYQWVSMSIMDKRIEELQRKNAQLEQIIQEGKENAAFYESQLGKDWLAFQQGWVEEKEEE